MLDRLATAVADWEKAADDERARLEGAASDSLGRRGLMAQWVTANPMPAATLAQVADHIEHVRRTAGVDHVGIGGDFDGIEHTPVGLEDASTFPRLFAELVRRGWSDDDLRKLAGRNLLRVLRAAEGTASRLRRERQPSTRTIEELDARPSPHSG